MVKSPYEIYSVGKETGCVMMALSDPERLGKEVWVINNPNKAVVNRRSSKDAAIEHGNDDPAGGTGPISPSARRGIP